MPPLDTLVAAEDEAVVLHFASPAKPWLGLLPGCRPNTLYRTHLATVLGSGPCP